MFIDGTPITLWCLEYGSGSFFVIIGNNNSIYDLKKAIFDEISIPDNVKAKNLSLWSVNIEERQLESNTPNGLMTDENKIKIATETIGNTFHGVQRKNIQVIVRVPVATGESKIFSQRDTA
ncbi:serine/threonine protein kinase [Gigaspora margarita]|uniref:Serine/threonine protein kinase n=1 Tax=Gigaspora margarita TaxID=4874 RepID=A0A8H3X9T3_GIGMA|nr:serine/threonine protein kinase [Gigaspora margarita]